MFSTALSGVPLRSADAASGVLSTCQQVSSVLGVAVIGFVFSMALAGMGVSMGGATAPTSAANATVESTASAATTLLERLIERLGIG